jgi:hypothetical protein
MLEPVFNDLSAAQPAADLAAAIDRMSRLIRLLRDAPDHGLDPGLRIPQTFHSFQLGPNYRVFDWLYDTRVSREQTLFLLTLVTRSPYLDQAPEEIQDRALLVDLRIEELASDALRAAYLLEVPLISFLEVPWDHPFVNCECEELIDDAVTPARPIQLRNISEPDHFPVHADWIRERRKRSIESAGDLWNRRDSLFPHLEFCPSVEAQLIELRPSEPRFQQVLNKLFDLEGYFSGWGAGAFDPDAFPKCNPASPETLERYSEDYIHVTSDSRKVVASWHLYLTPGKGRLYFAADGANRRGIICHVGDKLPDATYGRT